MSVLTPTRRAEAFARLLESGAHTDDPVTEPMVTLAEALRAVPAPAGPEPEFRAALRRRLVAVAAVQETTAPPSPTSRVRQALSSWRWRRRMALVAGAVAGVTAISGVGIGASRSLPGDLFYGVKRATESVQLATAQGAEAKGKRHLEFARTRLAEMKALVAESRALGPATPHGPDAAAAAGPPTSTLVATLQDMDSQTRAGANDLLDAYRSSRRLEPLVTLNTFTRTQYADLRGLVPELPSAVRQRALGSLALLRDVWATSYTAATGTTPPGGWKTPGGSSRSQAPTPRRSGGPTPTTSATPTAPGSTLGNGSKGATVKPPVVSPIPLSPLPTNPLPSGSTNPLPDVTSSPLPTSLLPLPSVSLSPTSLLGS